MGFGLQFFCASSEAAVLSDLDCTAVTSEAQLWAFCPLSICMLFPQPGQLFRQFFSLFAFESSIQVTFRPDSGPLALTALFLLQTHSILPYPRSGLLPPLPRGLLSSGFCYLTLFYYHETAGYTHVPGQWRFPMFWPEGYMRFYQGGWVDEAFLSEVGFQSGWTT